MIHRAEHPHPAHEGFAEAIGADILSLSEYSIPGGVGRHSIPEEIINGPLLSDYDIFISEGTRALYGSLAKRLTSDSTLIYLVGDHDLYQLTDDSYQPESTLNRLISEYGIDVLSAVFDRYIDGCMVISEFTGSCVETVLTDKPYRIAHPYIQPSVYRTLEHVSPNLESKTAVTVGSYSYYKGQDLLVDAWESVREAHPGAELKLVGTGYPPEFQSVPGVTVAGYVENLADAFEGCSLYVQPSRADGFGVSVVEAMHSGLPAIVTTTTGSKSEVERVSSDLITDPSRDAIANAISAYFSRDFDARCRLSQAAQKRGSKFDCESRKDEFRSQFDELVSDISGSAPIRNVDQA
ncbi:hexosyltransferase, glycosyltransferase [Halosimplex carlsbadense 2-9-1]|uniref:Hexosyltransferase, glycosyltransferase n=2 Tax=Halosimplex carlsbadense TaxID=171164 RepID=M0D627_9EURY|nr:hexosyltransferase, glycosyltransferase [Halosimplex carlsbadense 2-9-1]